VLKYFHFVFYLVCNVTAFLCLYELLSERCGIVCLFFCLFIPKTNISQLKTRLTSVMGGVVADDTGLIKSFITRSQFPKYSLITFIQMIVTLCA